MIAIGKLLRAKRVPPRRHRGALILARTVLEPPEAMSGLAPEKVKGGLDHEESWYTRRRPHGRNLCRRPDGSGPRRRPFRADTPTRWCAAGRDRRRRAEPRSPPGTDVRDDRGRGAV